MKALVETHYNLTAHYLYFVLSRSSLNFQHRFRLLALHAPSPEAIRFFALVRLCPQSCSPTVPLGLAQNTGGPTNSFSCPIFIAVLSFALVLRICA